MAPLNKRFTVAAAAALNTNVIAVDQESTLNFWVSGPNVIMDVVNDPDPAAGLLYTISLWKGGQDTGLRWYSNSISPASAGRLRPTPVKLSGGQYQLRCMQTLGALTATAFIVQVQHP